MKILATALAFSCALHAQQQGCTQHREFSMGAATGQTAPAGGNFQVVPIPNDLGRNVTICSILLNVTQSATPANYQLLGCTDTTCANPQVLTPFYTGHASYVDTYTLMPSYVVLPVLRGKGVYLNLSSAPASANVQVFYSAP